MTTTPAPEQPARPELGTLAYARYNDGSGGELALFTATGWQGERGPIDRATETAYTFEVIATRETVDWGVRRPGGPNEWGGTDPGGFNVAHYDEDTARYLARPDGFALIRRARLTFTDLCHPVEVVPTD